MFEQLCLQTLLIVGNLSQHHVISQIQVLLQRQSLYSELISVREIAGVIRGFDYAGGLFCTHLDPRLCPWCVYVLVNVLSFCDTCRNADHHKVGAELGQTYENIFHIPKSQQAREHDAILYHQRD